MADTQRWKEELFTKIPGDLNSCHFKPQSVISHLNPNYKIGFCHKATGFVTQRDNQYLL